MKRLRKSVILLFLIAMCLFICSCGRSKKAECPFTEITWENTLDEVLALEGEPLDSYPSTYSGTTYIFSKDFHDMSGTIKYMFDDNDRLMSMACFDSDMGTAKGNVWYLESGNIIVGVMSTGVNEAVQYQFLHPDVSNEKPQ